MADITEKTETALEKAQREWKEACANYNNILKDYNAEKRSIETRYQRAIADKKAALEAAQQHLSLIAKKEQS